MLKLTIVCLVLISNAVTGITVFIVAPKDKMFLNTDFGNEVQFTNLELNHQPLRGSGLCMMFIINIKNHGFTPLNENWFLLFELTNHNTSLCIK